MSTVHRLVTTAIFIFFCMTALYTLAEAKRLGGGRSIGNKSSISRSFSAMKQQTPQRQQQATNTRPSFGGMGGLLTGLLAGTLLGSFLGGGAFAHFGILDILLFGLMVFFLYTLFARRRLSQSTEYQYVATEQQNSSVWEHLAGTDGDDDKENQTSTLHNGGIENFDTEDFLKGAKILFTRMQESWATRDLEDIKKFTTKTLFDDITQQAHEDPTPSPVVVIHIQAELTGTQVLEEEESADVLFRATLQEDEATTNISEIWRFTRTKHSDSSWKLDGITQV